MNKLPIYYHIPKCGGTYIFALYQYLNKENEKKIRKPSGNWNNNQICRRINIYLDNKRYLGATGIIEIEDLLKLNCKLESHSNAFSIKELYNLIDNKKIKITSIFIEPTGDGNMSESRKEVDKLLAYINKKPVYFTIIRDVFQRIYSEYAYLVDDMSNHEPTHEYYRLYHDFEQFLIQSNRYDNQTSRQIAYNISLDNNSFENIKRFFDDFIILTMQNIKEAAIKVWQECYGWSANCDNDNLFPRNKNINKKKLSIEDISKEAREQFLIKTEWDRKLYAYLS
jgi:hypothetical protein